MASLVTTNLAPTTATPPRTSTTRSVGSSQASSAPAPAPTASIRPDERALPGRRSLARWTPARPIPASLHRENGYVRKARAAELHRGCPRRSGRAALAEGAGQLRDGGEDVQPRPGRAKCCCQAELQCCTERLMRLCPANLEACERAGREPDP